MYCAGLLIADRFDVLPQATRPAFSLLDTLYRYIMKKYTPAIIQITNNPQMRKEVRPLTSKTPMLKRIAPIVRIRSFFIATTLHRQLLPLHG
jgi:hypothetical protein